MSKLFTLHRSKPESGTVKDIQEKYITLAEQAYLNKTNRGQFDTTDDVQGMINILQGIPGAQNSVSVQTKIAELNNKALQFESKKNDKLNAKENYDSKLKSQLQKDASGNYKNLGSLISAYASTYNDYANAFDENVIVPASKRYGSDDTVDDATLKYRNDLMKKAEYYSKLFNLYNSNFLNPSAYAVVIDTNPANGTIISLDIVPNKPATEKDSFGVDESKFMMTDIPVNGLAGNQFPMYLSANNAGKTKDGKLIKKAQFGNKTFEALGSKSSAEGTEDQSVGILKIKKENVPWQDSAFIFNQSEVEQRNTALKELSTSGLDLSKSTDINFDSNDIPNGSVLKMGSRLFYQPKNSDKILELDGKDENEKKTNLESFLKSSNIDSEKITRYQITSSYLKDDSGSSKVDSKKVNSSYFEPAGSIPQSTLGKPTAQQMKERLDSFEQGQSSPEEQGEGFFTNRVNRQKKPSQPKESSGGKSSVNDVIDKGNSFFRSKVTA